MTPIWPSMIGKKYQHLTVLAPEVIDGRTWLYCRCDCGNSGTYLPSSLREGRQKGCGCQHGVGHITHGHTLNASKTPEWSCWRAMQDRCYNKNIEQYLYYGERGITVCQRWINNFEDFLRDMGHRPTPNHSIDRINNDGNYEPSNCRWATKKEQIQNR